MRAVEQFHLAGVGDGDENVVVGQALNIAERHAAAVRGLFPRLRRGHLRFVELERQDLRCPTHAGTIVEQDGIKDNAKSTRTSW